MTISTYELAVRITRLDRAWRAYMRRHLADTSQLCICAAGVELGAARADLGLEEWKP